MKRYVNCELKSEFLFSIEKYKRNLCLHYERVIHVITVFSYGEYDGNISILILHHQDGLECREGHLGGVQQDKHMFPL